MRIIHILLFITMLTWLTNCTTSTLYPFAMQQAEECMNIYPDSALLLLQKMSDSIYQYPEEVRMYWHLLVIQAKDKQYIIHTSDSLINHIVNFYEGYNDKSKLMMAYYYQGSVYRDMNDAPRALKAFQKALEVKIPNNELSIKAYNQMGTLFMRQGLYDEVIEVNRKAIELYVLQGKENKTSYAWRDIARMYDEKGRKDSALFCYEKACEIALEDKDSIRYLNILSELGCLYYEIGKQDTAKQILTAMTNIQRVRNKSNIYSYLGNIYEDSEQWDSLYYYRQEAIAVGDIHKKYDNIFSLALLEKKRGNEKQALHYMEQALWLNDSIREITRIEEVAKINSLYNYQHTEAENARLLLSQERYEKVLLMTVLIVLVAIGVCFYFVMKWKKECQRYQENEGRLQEWQKKAHLYSQETIAKNEKKVKELEGGLQNKSEKDRGEEVEKTLLRLEQLKLQNREIQLSIDGQELAVKLLRNSDVYWKFRRISLGESMELHVADWTELRQEINKAYPRFMENIQWLYPKMTKVETRICLLAKVGMTSTQIARVLGYSKSGVTSARDRLYKKMFNEKVTEEKFAEFIKCI